MKSPIVARINLLLAEQGIAKAKFYEDCHITSASLSQWNTGKSVPRLRNVEVIAKYLHTSPDFLLTGLGDKFVEYESEKPITEYGLSDQEREIIDRIRRADAVHRTAALAAFLAVLDTQEPSE